MKILAIQGSPRGREGNTEIILNEFLSGAVGAGAEAETVYLKSKKIKPCVGCYTCWTKTPGVCAIKDDMAELLTKVRECDIIVYATPLYNYNVTALLKAFQERMLPLADPHLVKEGGSYRHPARYEHSRKMVLISNCGFPDTSYYEGLCRVFRHLEKSSGTELIGEILVPAGEMLKQENLRALRKGFHDALVQAGREMVKEGRVSRKTEEIIQNPVFPRDEIAAMANLWWDSYLQGKANGAAQTGTTQDIRLLLKGMTMTFNPRAGVNVSGVIQFDVSGTQPGNWFITIKDGKCEFGEGVYPKPDLTIKTPSEIWLAIANKELDGQQAFLEGKYTAEGDMALMMNMRNLFAGN
jgi:multimeric flavodoxin WrbA